SAPSTARAPRPPCSSASPTSSPRAPCRVHCSPTSTPATAATSATLSATSTTTPRRLESSQSNPMRRLACFGFPALLIFCFSRRVHERLGDLPDVAGAHGDDQVAGVGDDLELFD